MSRVPVLQLNKDQVAYVTNPRKKQREIFGTGFYIEGPEKVKNGRISEESGRGIFLDFFFSKYGIRATAYNYAKKSHLKAPEIWEQIKKQKLYISSEKMQ